MTSTILNSQRNAESLLAGRLLIDPTKLGATGQGPTFTPETLHLLPISADLPVCTTCDGCGTVVDLFTRDECSVLPGLIYGSPRDVGGTLSQPYSCPDCKGQRYPIGERITIAVECAGCKGTGLAGVNNSGHKVGCYSCVSTGQRPVATALLEAVLEIGRGVNGQIDADDHPPEETPHICHPDASWLTLFHAPPEYPTDISSLLPHADWSSSHALKLTQLEVV